MLRLIRFCSPQVRTLCTIISSGSNRALEAENLPQTILVKDLTTQYHDYEARIVEIFKMYPDLQRTTFTDWKRYFDEMSGYDFAMKDSLTIISTYPHVLMLPEKQFEVNLRRWFTCGLGIEYFKFLLLNCPYFLHIHLSEIEKRMPYFKSIAPTNKLLLRLLIQCPNVMFEDWNSITSKVDYLQKEMRVEVEEIFMSVALSKPMDHIKLRHELLEKCGLYVAPSKWIHKRNKKEDYRNPHLKRIVDNADISFARKIAKLSAEEYLAFHDLWHLEMNEYEEEEPSLKDAYNKQIIFKRLKSREYQKTIGNNVKI